MKVPKNVLMAINQFKRKQKRGWIDVWWLYDDGGLTLLLPYILTTRKLWSDCKLRVFALATKHNDLDREQRNMAALLSKFRIDYSNVTIIPDLSRPPNEANQKAFMDIISKWREGEQKTNETSDHEANLNPRQRITDSEILALREKVNLTLCCQLIIL